MKQFLVVGAEAGMHYRLKSFEIVCLKETNCEKRREMFCLKNHIQVETFGGSSEKFNLMMQPRIPNL